MLVPKDWHSKNAALKKKKRKRKKDIVRFCFWTSALKKSTILLSLSILVDMNILREKTRSVLGRIYFCRDKHECNPKIQLLSAFKALEKQFSTRSQKRTKQETPCA